MYRRVARTKWYGAFGRNNRRSLCENNPKGCWLGRWRNRGIANNAFCLESKKFEYNESGW
mgnify:FL=1